jgi:hypothetical protein
MTFAALLRGSLCLADSSSGGRATQVHTSVSSPFAQFRNCFLSPKRKTRFRRTEPPVAAAADRSRPPAAGARPDYNAKAAPRLRDAALIEKWRDCSLTAGTSLSRYWSRSGYQLHILYTCSEPGRCRPWNRYRNHRSPLSRSAHYCERRRPGSKSLPSR